MLEDFAPLLHFCQCVRPTLHHTLQTSATLFFLAIDNFCVSWESPDLLLFKLHMCMRTRSSSEKFMSGKNVTVLKQGKKAHINTGSIN